MFFNFFVKNFAITKNHNTLTGVISCPGVCANKAKGSVSNVMLPQKRKSLKVPFLWPRDPSRRGAEHACDVGVVTSWQ